MGPCPESAAQAEELRRVYRGPELRSRVRRLLGYQCTDAVFTPPSYKPAQVVSEWAAAPCHAMP